MDEQELLRKVQGLLAKAEGTDNENEAATFYEGAQRLMVKYAIDEERVRASQRKVGSRVEEPVVEDYMFSSYAHHREAKQDLFQAVAKSQHIRSWPYSNRKFSNDHRVRAAGLTGLYESQWTKLLGYKSDIELTKMVYLSLLIQATKFANEDWNNLYGKNEKYSSYADGRIGKFTWLSSHMIGFAERIGARFREVAEGVYRDAIDGNALILDKDANIQEWMYENGYATRPDPYHRCYAFQPPEMAPLVTSGKNKGQPNSKWHPLGCGVWLKANDEPHPHNYTIRFSWSSSSRSVAVGPKRSYEAGRLGRSAADRADIGNQRVKAGVRSIGGGR